MDYGSCMDHGDWAGRGDGVDHGDCARSSDREGYGSCAGSGTPGTGSSLDGPLRSSHGGSRAKGSR